MYLSVSLSLSLLDFAAGNQLTGTLPTELGNLEALTSFELDTNRLEGTVPISYERLKNLQKVTFHSNDLTGTLDQAFCTTQNAPIGILLADCAKRDDGNNNASIEKVTCNCCTECF
jgi:hypothetical protein